MNLKELEKQIIFEGFNPSAFLICRSMPSCDDRLILLINENAFEIGFMERGVLNKIKSFKIESEACKWS
jgi:hypothetical protein